MRIAFRYVVLVILATAGLTASAQTDVGLSLYGAFHGTTTANGVQQSPANSAGGLFELRHLSNPILGFEGTYSYNRANQRYSPVCSSGVCPPLSVTTIKAGAHELTFDWVPSVGVANFRPFGVLGVGAIFHVPDSGEPSGTTQTSTKGVFVYGAGLDWGLLPHLGLRFQYRGNLYQPPDLTHLYTSASTFTHTAEPMIGVYFRL